MMWKEKGGQLIAAFKNRKNDHFAGRKHTEESINKMRVANYNGKPKYIKHGYVMVWAPNHPRAHYGRVPEHVLIAEKVLGRFLKRDEVVHHINSHRADNRNENLLICTSSYHHYLHGLMCGLWTFNRHIPERDPITGKFCGEIAGGAKAL